MDLYRVTAIALTVVGLVFLAGVPFLLKRWLYRIVSMFLGLATLAGAAYQAHKGYEVWADDKRVAISTKLPRSSTNFFVEPAGIRLSP